MNTNRRVRLRSEVTPLRQRANGGRTLPRLASDWRGRIVPALVRVWCGLCLAAVPGLDDRFGDATLVLVALVLSAFVAVIVYLAWRMTAEGVAGLLVADVLA